MEKSISNSDHLYIMENHHNEEELYSLFYGKPTKSQLRDVERTKPVQPKQDIGRNDLCPCGSGKKFKKCCNKSI